MTEGVEILVVEDDAKTAESIRLYLEHAGFGVRIARDGREGLDAARTGRFALVVLDLMLPRLDGQNVCRALRRESDLPIIMLTARTTEDDRVEGLELGADDYVLKPFSPRELVARVRAVLRRSETPEAGGRTRLRFDGLEIDLEGRMVWVDGKSVSLTPAEFGLLVAMARSPGRVFRRDQLAERAFGQDFHGLDRTVDVHVKNLRSKIEPDRASPRWVQTVFGEGYRFGGSSPSR